MLPESQPKKSMAENHLKIDVMVFDYIQKLGYAGQQNHRAVLLEIHKIGKHADVKAYCA